MKRQSIIRGFLISMILISLVLAFGCATIGPTKKSYGGDQLQKLEIAVIKGKAYFTFLYSDTVVINAIDPPFSQRFLPVILFVHFCAGIRD